MLYVFLGYCWKCFVILVRFWEGPNGFIVCGCEIGLDDYNIATPFLK